MTVLLFTMAVSAKDGNWAIFGQTVPSPEQDDTFTSGSGVMGQYRIPVADDLQLGFLLGINQWNAETYRLNNGRFLSMKVAGDVTDLSIGAALIYKLPIATPEGLNLAAELGIVHHVLSSDVEAQIYTHQFGLSNELEFDDLTTLGIGLNVEWIVQKDITALAGVGYQWDILDKENVKLAGFDTGLRNGLEGVVLKFGIVIKTP